MAYTTIDDPSAYFQTALYSGSSDSTLAVTNDGNSDLQPDWVWIKGRNDTGNHSLVDSSRGVNKVIHSNAATAEADQDSRGYLSAFSSDGFTVSDGSTDGIDVKGNTKTYAAWQWKANGGTRTTHTESGANPGGGFQANTTAGFSIVDYVGTGGAGHVTHGLGVVPEAIIIKNRDEAESWLVYHVGIGNGKGLRLDTTAAADTTANHWANTTPNSSTIVVGGNPPNNKDAINYIAYCFAPIQGYSKFGSFTGNGNVDGPFIYTGFKPAFVMTKKSTGTGTGKWMIRDHKRDYNGSWRDLYADTTDAETSPDSNTESDLLSNGFKCRMSHSAHNENGGTYIYMAFAESPFVSSEGVPCTAR